MDAPYSPQRLSELAKMDGAIILASDASRIARANVHLVPGTRLGGGHRRVRHQVHVGPGDPAAVAGQDDGPVHLGQL